MDSNVQSFSFEVKPLTCNAKIYANLVNISKLQLNGLRLPTVRITVGNAVVQCYIKLRLSGLKTLTAKLHFENNDDINYDMVTTFKLDNKEHLTRINFVSLNDVQRSIQMICDITFYHNSIDIVTTQSESAQLSEEVLVNPEETEETAAKTMIKVKTTDGEMMVNANFLASVSPIFKRMIREMHGDERCIHLRESNIETFCTTMTFLSGNTPFSFPDDLRKRVERFALRHAIINIKSFFPVEQTTEKKVTVTCKRGKKCRTHSRRDPSNRIINEVIKDKQFADDNLSPLVSP